MRHVWFLASKISLYEQFTCNHLQNVNDCFSPVKSTKGRSEWLHDLPRVMLSLTRAYVMTLAIYRPTGVFSSTLATIPSAPGISRLRENLRRIVHAPAPSPLLFCSQRLQSGQMQRGQ